MRAGVWCGRAQIGDPNRWLDLVQDSGCTRVDLVINDLSAWRVNTRGKITARGITQNKPFKTYDCSKLERFGRLATVRGLELHTLFWVVPTPESVARAAQWLNAFQDSTGAAGHVLDCEEPITRSSFAAYDNDPDRMADHLAGMLEAPLGVTHIGYAPVHIVRPFVERARYALPQTYITTTSKLTPGSVGRICDRARLRLGAREVVGGFALYRQPKKDAIFDTLKALDGKGCKAAVGWHANGLKRHGAALKLALDKINAPGSCNGNA